MEDLRIDERAAVSEPAPVSAPAPANAWTRPRRRSAWSFGAAAVAIVLAVPIIGVVVDVAGADPGEVLGLLLRPRSAMLLDNTVQLTLVVVALSAVIGTATAWLVERTRLPGRRLWSVLLVLPVAMPDFVVGYAWHSLDRGMQPLLAATLVMVSGSSPLVHLPVSAALRRSDPMLEDVAAGLGHHRPAVFFRVTLPAIRGALIGGALMVGLAVLAEYGAFEIVRYQTFTTEIFTEFQFEPAAAAALSVPLVLLGALLAVGLRLVPGSPAAGTRPRRPRAHPLSPAATAVSLALLTVVALVAVAVPVGVLLGWLFGSHSSTLPATATVLQATGTTFGYCAGGAVLAVVMAVPVAFAAARGGRAARMLERGASLGLAVPGVVVALSLVFLSVRFADWLYETPALVVLAYAILTFPLALSCVAVSVRQLPEELGRVARSLGVGPLKTFALVTAPAIWPGLLAGLCLVFLTSTTELTATLVLAPIGAETLTTQFWAFQSEGADGAAAPYAATILALCVVPGALLSLWFDRAPDRMLRAARRGRRDD